MFFFRRIGEKARLSIFIDNIHLENKTKIEVHVYFLHFTIGLYKCIDVVTIYPCFVVTLIKRMPIGQLENCTKNDFGLTLHKSDRDPPFIHKTKRLCDNIQSETVSYTRGVKYAILCVYTEHLARSFTQSWVMRVI